MPQKDQGPAFRCHEKVQDGPLLLVRSKVITSLIDLMGSYSLV